MYEWFLYSHDVFENSLNIKYIPRKLEWESANFSKFYEKALRKYLGALLAYFSVSFETKLKFCLQKLKCGFFSHSFYPIKKKSKFSFKCRKMEVPIGNWANLNRWAFFISAEQYIIWYHNAQLCRNIWFVLSRSEKWMERFFSTLSLL